MARCKKKKKKLPQLINIHEPFTWAPFCAVAGPNPDRDQAVLQCRRLRHSTLCGRNPSTGVSGKCLPPLRALTFPLSHPLPLVPPQHLGQEVLSLRGGHPSIFPLPMQFTAAPHVWRHLSIFDQIIHFAANDPNCTSPPMTEGVI